MARIRRDFKQEKWKRGFSRAVESNSYDILEFKLKDGLSKDEHPNNRQDEPGDLESYLKGAEKSLLESVPVVRKPQGKKYIRSRSELEVDALKGEHQEMGQDKLKDEGMNPRRRRILISKTECLNLNFEPKTSVRRRRRRSFNQNKQQPNWTRRILL